MINFLQCVPRGRDFRIRKCSKSLNLLGVLLSKCRQLIPEVDTKSIVVALIDRLAQYAQRQQTPGMPADLNVFDVFYEQFQELTAVCTRTVCT